ncbi:hypothetical protein D3C80_1282630 [compost metagenome]
MIENVTENKGCAFQPWHTTQRREVWLHRVIAVALFPACRLVTGNGLHLHVGCQQIIAAVRFLMGTFHEKLCLKTLAHQAPLHIHQAGQHRIDTPLGHVFFQFIECIGGGHLFPACIHCFCWFSSTTARTYARTAIMLVNADQPFV